MTKFSFEVPIKHLNDFDDLQDFYFTLSFLYNRPEYVRYVREKLNEGVKCVWLDNSFNELEKADHSTTLVALWSEFQQHRVISPDDPKWTKEQIAHQFIQMNRSIVSQQLIVVVNSEEMLDYMKAHGARHFAYSYWCRYNRLYEEMEWAKDCHFLGMLSPYEVIFLKPPTCDTSMPIKIALQGINFNDWVREGCTHQHTKDIPSFFDVEMTKKQVETARDNINRLKEFINGK